MATRWPSCIGGHISVKTKLKYFGGAIFATAWLTAFLLCFAWSTQSMAAAPTPATTGLQPTGGVVTEPCRKVTPQTYNKRVRKLERIERLNDMRRGHRHRASRKVCKALFERIKQKLENICRPIHVVTGKTSVFDDHRTFTGISASSHEGLAINPDPGTEAWGSQKVRQWALRGAKFKVRLLGRERITRLIDLGPAGWVNRAIDFSRPLANAMRFFSFPTDTYGTVWRYRYGCR